MEGHLLSPLRVNKVTFGSELRNVVTFFCYNTLLAEFVSAMSVITAATYSVFGLLALGCWAHTWAANSLSRWASYFCFISSSDSPTSAPEVLNIQLHSEQPKP